MTLRSFLDEATADRKTVTVYAPERYDALAAHFEDRDVEIEHRPLPDDGTGGFVVVTEDGEFVGSLGVDAVRHLLEPARGSESRPSEAVSALMDLLADTTFRSFDKRQMRAAAREIEDRAYRTGRGTLRTGFQRLSALAAQRDLYEALAAESSLDVHVYARPEWWGEMPVAEGVTIHAVDDEEIGAFWFVVFDGGGDDRRACALLAEEESEGEFGGFWTYDAETVADVDAYLATAYPSPGKR